MGRRGPEKKRRRRCQRAEAAEEADEALWGGGIEAGRMWLEGNDGQKRLHDMMLGGGGEGESGKGEGDGGEGESGGGR